MRRQDLLDAVSLNALEHSGSAVLHEFYEEGFSRSEILNFPKEKWETLFSARKVSRLLQLKAALNPERILQQATEAGMGLLLYEDADYPELLRQIYNPPRLLWYLGEPLPGNSRYVSMVGSRDATLMGQRNARELGAWLGGRGIPVSSGLARGIDTSAHEGCLAAGGRALAVVASGLEEFCKPEPSRMIRKVLEQGVIFSEFPPDFPVYRRNFPLRNRIITGVASLLVVVEARLKSGTMTSVRHALEQDRDVYVCPGPMHSTAYAGSHSLIRDGAQLLSGFADLAQALDLMEMDAPAPFGALSAVGREVLELIGQSSMTPDELTYRLQLPLREILMALLELEDSGLIAREAGGGASLIRG